VTVQQTQRFHAGSRELLVQSVQAAVRDCHYFERVGFVVGVNPVPPFEQVGDVGGAVYAVQVAITELAIALGAQWRLCAVNKRKKKQQKWQHVS
jgi:hypothetical protein